MAIDLYNNENRWKNWREEYKDKDIEEITRANSDLVKKFLFDMENGSNVAGKSKKGGRSFVRLNTLRTRLIFIVKLFEQRYNNTDIIKLSPPQVNETFNSMQKGEIKKHDGEKFKSVADYCKIFKTLWHWHMKVCRLQSKPKQILDITSDLSTTYDTKPVWVYLKAEEMDKLINASNNYYKPLFAFAYDTGARTSEIFSIMVDDITKDNQDNIFVNIKDEYSKGGKCGRKIKLMLCGNEILKYIKENKLKSGDKLFSHSVFMSNDYLSALAKKTFGDGKSEGGEYYSKMTLYDFRHNSSCFWLDRYKRSSDLMYRFGWKSEKYIHYYSEFKGKRDGITSEDMFVDISKLDIEKKYEALKERLEKIENEMISRASGRTKLKEEKRAEIIEAVKNFGK